MSEAATEVGVDGRTARRDRNRAAVLDAVIELFTEDNVRPRPEEVAERSGVSLRSVYRYYSDPEDLLRAAMERHLERVRPLSHLHAIGEGALDDRIERLVAARLRLHEGVGPAARAARVASTRNETIGRRYAEARIELARQVERHFAPELDALPATERLAAATAVDALLQLETLDHYRIHRRLSKARTSAALREAVARLLRLTR